MHKRPKNEYLHLQEAHFQINKKINCEAQTNDYNRHLNRTTLCSVYQPIRHYVCC